MVDLDAEELDLVPGVDLAGAASKEGDDALQALVEFVEAVLPDLVEASLGNEVGDLEIIDAVNENGEAAVIHVAEAGFRVRRQAREPEPENIDGHASLDDGQTSGLPREGMAAIASDGQIGGDLDGAVRRVGADTGDDSVVLDEASGFPTHTQRETRITGSVRGEEVQEIPLRHEGDKLCVRGQVPQVTDLEPLAANNSGDSVDPGVANFEELVEQAELIHQLQRGGMDRVAAKIAEEVFVLFEYGDGESGPGQQQAEHDTCWASADDAGGLHERTLL